MTVYRELQWIARERQHEMLREVEQMRLHRLAAGPQRKPARPGWRRMLNRRTK